VEERAVGRSGLRVSRLGLGSLTWGREVDQHDATEQLTCFVEAGGTLIDTAASYGDGAAESLIGALLGSVVAREDVVLCTKAGASRRGGVSRTHPSRAGMLADLDSSLRRLRTDHVDLWLVRGWGQQVPLCETLSALSYAVTSGKARYVGVANYTGWQTAHAATLAGSGAGQVELVAAQVEYSLLQREAEREVLPAARALGLGVLGWSALGRGVLTGKYREGTPADSRGAAAHLSGFVGAYLNPRSARVVDALVTAADGLDCLPAQVALAWARDRDGVASLLVGARTATQLRASLASEELDLPTEIGRALDEVSALS
jgi:aryl-alcohol dehydrogenase-like predicted oxidoreductase